MADPTKLLRESTKFFDSVYTNYAARDLFGKVLPGFILLSAWVFSSRHDIDIKGLIENLPILLWLLLYALAWGIGLGVQALSEIIGIHRAFPDKERSSFQKRLNKFTSEQVTLRQWLQRERYVIIKEACGNLSTSTLLALVVMLLNYYFPNQQFYVLVGNGALFVVVWAWFHIEHRDRQKNYEESVEEDSYRDREEPRSSPLPHHRTYGSVYGDSADQAESDPGEQKTE